MTVEPGNRGIVQRFGGETGYFIKGRVPEAGDSCVLYPVDGEGLPVCIPMSGFNKGDMVFLLPDFNFDFIINVPDTQLAPDVHSQTWLDAQFRQGDTKWFGYLAGGTYTLTVKGWWTAWSDYVDRYQCGAGFTDHPKLITCCWNGIYLVIDNGGSISNISIGSICTDRNLSALWGQGSIVIPVGARVGIYLSDSYYPDNFGNTTFTLERQS